MYVSFRLIAIWNLRIYLSLNEDIEDDVVRVVVLAGRTKRNIRKTKLIASLLLFLKNRTSTNKKDFTKQTYFNEEKKSCNHTDPPWLLFASLLFSQNAISNMLLHISEVH